MQIDPTIKARVDRMDAQKANRIRTIPVETKHLPDSAEDGDAVLFKGQLHVMSDGDWQNTDDVLRGTVAAVDAHVDRVEAQKADRIRTVESLPDTGVDGDAVSFAGQLHVMSDGAWRNIDNSVMAAIMALTERVSALEGTEHG